MPEAWSDSADTAIREVNARVRRLGAPGVVVLDAAALLAGTDG
jgi:hypothetical protein